MWLLLNELVCPAFMGGARRVERLAIIAKSQESPLGTLAITRETTEFIASDSSYLRHPAHAYGDTGAYTVTLIVTAGISADTFQQTVIISEPAGIQSSLFSQLLKIYSNPASGMLNVELMTYEGTTLRQIELLDMSGKIITAYSEASAQQVKINTRLLPAGLYFIRIKLSSGESRVKKIVIEE